ncbi:hypothetical protein FB45DRAFT_314963 [Roridomyces roridus]|uniref:Secreted protein n=1 Tax=Roridomyces roridus TaxID=1738132 RepID=A0AAD7FA61_9AGAR|nr:hypothetical protein FB45DRAFT_314963 [Roridomyces roridus]
MVPPWIVSGISALLCVLLSTRSLRRQHLQTVPGPFLAKYTNLWLAYHAYRGRRYIAVHKAHQRSMVPWCASHQTTSPSPPHTPSPSSTHKGNMHPKNRCFTTHSFVRASPRSSQRATGWTILRNGALL